MITVSGNERKMGHDRVDAVTVPEFNGQLHRLERSHENEQYHDDSNPSGHQQQVRRCHLVTPVGHKNSGEVRQFRERFQRLVCRPIDTTAYLKQSKII
jgi:hypothetical protein